eukprot:TRINITY_DN692_c0_g1_i14.p1 TRINITY_DN692_c0_g1~~TRINITY_DN692_c0_g1_i14.p1  ORF type:complete len:263 (+),score=55.60 TRINITY_DN692_c0_g1_i14:47-790(+)
MSNFDPKQLKIGMWSGDVVLNNLSLTEDALDELNLPINVISGSIGTLTIQIPWRSLKNEPTKVVLQDLFIVASPKPMDQKPSPEETAEREYHLKLSQLEAHEVVKKNADGAENIAGDEKMQSSLAQSIINNLKVTIETIHIRYEDTLSTSNKSIALGLTLDSLSVSSLDESGNEKLVKPDDPKLLKHLDLSNLSLYWQTNGTMLSSLPQKRLNEALSNLVATDSNVPESLQYGKSGDTPFFLPPCLI